MYRSLPFILILVGLVPTLVSAQVPPVAGAAGPGRIAGQVTTAEGQPLENVAITLRSAADSVIVTGALTSADGRFRIDGLAAGDYLLRVSLIGYLPRNSEQIRLTADEPAVDLGTIQLTVSAVELDAVRADAERAAVVVEADRTTYNTRSMPIASIGSAVDVLRAVPELEVDVEDNVKLRGNQSVAIHINGRPAPLRGEQLANFLKQLPGNRIDRVEVMPNPSARHDPEGMGGIVNIVLQENLDLGLSGSVSANASTRNRQYFNGRINYQKGRVTLFTGAGVSTYESEASNYDLRRNLVTQPVTVIEQDSWSSNESVGLNGDWTVEVKVGEQATVWSNAWLYGGSSTRTGATDYGILDDLDGVLERYDRMNDSDHENASYNLGLGFKQVFERQKEELTVDARLNSGRNSSDARDTRLFEILQGDPVDLPHELTLNDIDAGGGNLSLQADYFRPLGAARLDVGYRAYRRDQDNDNRLLLFAAANDAAPRESTRSGYDYTEVFHSIYSTYGRTVGRFAVQAGLRAELSRTDFDSRVGGASFSRNYNTLFPSLNLSYNPAAGRTLRFLYSKRISRPSAFYLDPYVPATDPLNVQRGNPDLKPSYTQSLSLDFSWTGPRGTLRVAPFFRRTTDMWERIRTVDTLGVATNRYENGLAANSWGSSFTVSLPPTGRLSGSTSISVYRDERDGTNISSAYRRSAWLWSLGGNLGIRIREGLTGQIFANHFPTQSILQGRASGYTFTSISVRQQLWGTRGSISLNVSDPLNLYRYTSATQDATYIQSSRSSMSSRVAMIGFSLNFGKPPQQQSRRVGGEESTGETIRVR